MHFTGACREVEFPFLDYQSCFLFFSVIHDLRSPFPRTESILKKLSVSDSFLLVTLTFRYKVISGYFSVSG